jgi:hypothetical protein
MMDEEVALAAGGSSSDHDEEEMMPAGENDLFMDLLDPQKSRFEVISKKAPLPWFHPTHAVIKDRVTGETYKWNSRMHRKMRHTVPISTETKQHSPRLWSCEPHIITWWINLTNEIANVFWTISGIFATWPAENTDASDRVVYASGIIAGVFMIASCYFGYVEAINHTHSDIRIPGEKHTQVRHRHFIRPRRIYGILPSPLGHAYNRLDDKKRERLVEMGFPIVETTSGKLVTMAMLDEAIAAVLKKNEDLSVKEHQVLLRTLNYACTAQAVSVAAVPVQQHRFPYIMWTWTPAINHVGVLAAHASLVAAVVYLVPMCVGYPLAKNDNAKTGVTLFFVDILQVIPYIIFVVVGHLYIAEAAGDSWWKPAFNNIGWWISVLNTLGAYGFLLCGALAIPGTLESTCCANMAKWGSAFACFWGSCSYLVGGILMFVEFANPEPIVIRKKQSSKALHQESNEVTSSAKD